MEEYHQVSDAYIDSIVAKLEQLQEAREDVDVEFSVRIYFYQIHSYHSYHVHKIQQLRASAVLIYDTCTVRRPNPQLPPYRNLRAQQAVAKQADLALVPAVRAEKVRLGCAWGRAA